MKQKLRVFLTLLLCAVASVGWAEDATITFAELNLSNGTRYSDPFVSGDVSVTFACGREGIAESSINTGKYYTTGSGIRVYASEDGLMTFRTSSGQITKIVVTCDGASSNKYAIKKDGYSVSSGSCSINDNVATWNGSTSEITFTNKNGSEHWRVQKVVITYGTGDTPVDPSVATTTTIDASGITNTDVFTSTAAGQLTATVTAGETTVSGATVTWSSSKEDVATIDANTGVVTLVAAGSVTFTANYAGVSGQYKPSAGTYEMTVTNSAPYVQLTNIEIIPNYTFWGKTAQFSGNSFDELTGEKDNVALVWKRGNGSTYANQSAMRFYKDNTLTFTAPQGYEIKSIDLAVSGTFDDLAFSPSGFDSESKKWSGSSATVKMSRPSNASSYSTISKFTITIGQPSTEPTISADDVNLAFNATGGSLTYTLTNAVDGGVMTAESSETWLTVGTPANGSVALSCAANSETTERTAIVTLKYTYNTNETVTTTVTVTQAAAPVVYTTIPALFEAATNTETAVNVTFGGWVISAVHNNNAYLTDNQGHGLIIYASGHGFNVGDVLTGTASCNLQVFKGSAELTNLTSSTEGLTITKNGTLTAQTIAINELGGVNTGALLTYENLSFNGNELVDVNNNAITPFNTFYTYNFESDKKYNVTGIYLQFNSTKEILPRSADDVEEYIAPQHTVKFFVNGVEQTEAEALVSEGDAITFPEATATIEDKVFLGWTTAAIEGVAEIAPTIVSAATMGTADVTYYAVYATQEGEGGSTATLTSANIKASYVEPNEYKERVITDSEGNTWNAYAMSYQHSKATSDFYYLQIKKSDANQSYYIQVPQFGTKITQLTMTVSNSSKPMEDGGNTSTLFFSANNSTSSAEGEGVVSETGTNSVTLDCSSLDLNTGYITASGAVRVWDITVTYSSATYTGYCTTVPVPEPVTVTITDAGLATFCSDKALDFTNSTTVYAYKAVISGTQVILTKVTKVPAKTGVLLRSVSGGAVEEASIPVTTGVKAFTDNAFVAVMTEITSLATETTEEDGVTYVNYILNKVNGVTDFYKANGKKVGANKAYLRIDKATASKGISIGYADETDGIRTIGNEPQKVDGIYNLSGQRVSNAQKGIYIVNGKKVVMK